MEIELAAAAIEWSVERFLVDPLVDRAMPRVKKLFEVATRKLQGRAAEVDERTMMKAISEAAITDDPLVADYLGGVLASGNGSDDAVAMIALVGRLSGLQLRLHYVIYRQVWLSESGRPSMTDLRSQPGMSDNEKVFLRSDDLHAALPIGENGEGVRSMLSALHVLAREDLISGHGSAGTTGLRSNPVAYDIQEPHGLAAMADRQYPAAGLVCAPTPSGIELFLRGCGCRDSDPTYIRQLDPLLVQADVAAVRGARVFDLPAA